MPFTLCENINNLLKLVTSVPQFIPNHILYISIYLLSISFLENISLTISARTKFWNIVKFLSVFLMQD